MQLYALLAVSKHQALDAALANAESKSKHWKREAEAKQEAKVARLLVATIGDAKARAEDDLI